MSEYAFAVTELSQVGEVRRAAASLARRLNFTPTDIGNASLIATELATNLVKHAREGQLLLRSLEQGVVGLEILTVDRGPGMVDVQRCLEDGYSTAGSPGTGLGAVQRLASSLDIYSVPQVGTVLAARLWAGEPGEAPPLNVGAINIPKVGEDLCGDAWDVGHAADRSMILVADGLGHGPAAAAAAREAVRVFRESLGRPSASIFEAMHPCLRPTRGAAVAIAAIDLAEEKLYYMGVGNIAGTILTDGKRQGLVSQNGTVGLQMPRLQEFVYSFPADALLVMHSDGLTSQWRFEASAGLGNTDLSLLAGMLYRDFARGNDDVTVVTARRSPSENHR